LNLKLKMGLFDAIQKCILPIAKPAQRLDDEEEQNSDEIHDLFEKRELLIKRSQRRLRGIGGGSRGLALIEPLYYVDCADNLYYYDYEIRKLVELNKSNDLPPETEPEVDVVDEKINYESWMLKQPRQLVDDGSEFDSVMRLEDVLRSNENRKEFSYDTRDYKDGDFESRDAFYMFYPAFGSNTVKDMMDNGEWKWATPLIQEEAAPARAEAAATAQRSADGPVLNQVDPHPSNVREDAATAPF